MFDFLTRKKTYIMAALLALTALIYQVDLCFHDLPETAGVFETGFLSPQWYETLKVVFGGGSIASLAAKLNRNTTK